MNPMGKRKGVDLTGIFLLDKDKGVSSNRALQQIRRMYDAQKAGHTGSLDPMATGLLPICFGKATKICQYLLDSDKTYEATIQLGIQTDTGDTEGEVIETSEVPDLTVDDIAEILLKFKGNISQVPPMYSALKKDGVPLYKLARQGIEVERKSRNITIYELKCLAYENVTHELRIKVKSSKGTYIRTLAEDIAKSIGCGAHLTALRRTACGLYDLSSAQQYFPTKELEDISTFVLSAETAFQDKDIITIPQSTYDYLMKTGKFICDHPNHNGLYRLYLEGEGFFGVVILEQGKLIKKQLFI
jgi:tRNA pseudouridine55 synthase